MNEPSPLNRGGRENARKLGDPCRMRAGIAGDWDPPAIFQA